MFTAHLYSVFLPTPQASLIQASFQRFMRKPELRVKQAAHLSDLIVHMNFGCRCYLGKLSMKVENGHLVMRRYTQYSEQ